MARQPRSPIARGDSQVVPNAASGLAPTRRLRERIDGRWFEVEPLFSGDRPLDRQIVAGQGLSADDVAQVVDEML